MDEQGLVLLSLTFFFFFFFLEKPHTEEGQKKTSFPSALVDTVELYLSQKMLGFIVVFARCDDLNKSCWTDGYLFSSFFFYPKTHENRQNTVSKSTKNLSKSSEGERRESCRACMGSISATSIPGEGGGPWRTPALC